MPKRFWKKREDLEDWKSADPAKDLFPLLKYRPFLLLICCSAEFQISKFGGIVEVYCADRIPGYPVGMAGTVAAFVNIHAPATARLGQSAIAVLPDDLKGEVESDAVGCRCSDFRIDHIGHGVELFDLVHIFIGQDGVILE